MARLIALAEQPDTDLMRAPEREERSSQGAGLRPVQAALAAVFLLTGGAKLARLQYMVNNFERKFGYPSWMVRSIGAQEVGIAALLLLGSPSLKTVAQVFNTNSHSNTNTNTNRRCARRGA